MINVLYYILFIIHNNNEAFLAGMLKKLLLLRG